ncbi:MAG TPA: DUF3658 domain-containing protein [Chitinophagaceae bacterium]|nr:DUF3658 domain-containing protein [Chitinophagaceae bacterium]
MIDIKNAVHLVWSNPARGGLKNYFENVFPYTHVSIQTMYIDLSVGPLSDFITTNEQDACSDYWKMIDKAYFTNIPEEELYLLPNIDNQYNLSFPKDKPLVIWHGSEINEKIMLCRYCSLLKNDNLYEVNLDLLPVMDYKVNCLAQYPFEKIKEVISFVRKLEIETQIKYAHQWEALKRGKTNLRVLENNKIVFVNDDYIDDLILSNCSTEYQLAAKVIGATMGQFKGSLSDSFINYRIHVLISLQKIEGTGNLSGMRYFSIRKIIV